MAYHPKAFRTATVTVIPKPGKTKVQKEFAGGWRPISLLNWMGKVLEFIMAKRISKAAEEVGLLPEG